MLAYKNTPWHWHNDSITDNWPKKIARFVRWRIEMIHQEEDDYDLVRIWSMIPWVNKRIINKGKRVELEWKKALEIQLDNWSWVCYYIDNMRPVKIPWTHKTISRVGDINILGNRKVINITTDDHEKTCLFVDNLHCVWMPWSDKEWAKRMITHIFKSRQ